MTLDLTSKEMIKALLGEQEARPLKRFGQNFLISRLILDKIIQAANIKETETILEIGSGIGTLTQSLSRKAKKVIAIEKDRKMIEILRKTLKGFKNVEIIEGDVLGINISGFKFQDSGFKLVANLPFNVASPTIKKFLEIENPPEEITVMIQKEVAERICAKPPKMSILAISVNFYSQPQIMFFVPKSCFWPRPKVDAAVIRLKTKKEKANVDRDLFFRIVKAGFAHPRKQIINNLALGLAPSQEKKAKLDKEKVLLWLNESKIEPQKRAEALSLKDWLNLTKSFKQFVLK